MFLKNKLTSKASSNLVRKEGLPSIITKDMHMLGKIVSDGVVDFSGTLDGDIRCGAITIRPEGSVKGEVIADDVAVHGTVKGLIRAKNVHFYPSCQVEGVIIHEGLTIEDGATVDGKFKRSDRPQLTADTRLSDEEEETESSGNTIKIMDNIRLIR